MKSVSASFSPFRFELRDRCAGSLGIPLPPLSMSMGMGMSRDVEVAIEEGATGVRIGTKLFGERPRPTAAA